MSSGQQYEEKIQIREWKRAIPQAGYVKVGALRYGIRISNFNLSDCKQLNKPQALSSSQPSSLIMSPSSQAIDTKAICTEECCCCLGVRSSKTRLPLFQSAKNRTSSPSSTSLHQPTNIGSEIAVSSLKLKRETSPTVCCYNINSRSQSVGESHQSGKYSESFANAKRAADDRQPPKGDDTSVHPHKSLVRESVAERAVKKRENIGEIYYLKDKIRRFENPPNNIQENIINRSTTTKLPRSGESTDVDPVKSVSEDDQRICDDKNSRFGGKIFINRYESQSNQQLSEVKCNLRCANDDNNNKVRAQQTQSDSTQSSLIDARQLPRTKDRCFNGDNTKVTKVVIRHLEPIAIKKKSQVNSESPQVVHKQNILDDNDFSFIDSSSRSVSRSSSYSFASDELGPRDENVNCGRKARIPKITRINGCNYSRGSVGVRGGANQNIYSHDQLKRYLEHETNVRQPATHLIEILEKPNNLQQQRPSETFTPSSYSSDQTIAENLSTMDKSSRNTLKKFGFGRKTSSSASTSPERKPQTSKTERLRELTEKLKGHKTGSFKINNSRSMSPPDPPPLPAAPVPPPRKIKRNSSEISAASSFDNLVGEMPAEPTTNLHHIGKSKSVEPSSMFTRQLRSIQERFLRPNISASNLESMNRSKENLSDDKKANSASLKEEDFFAKLTRPESRTIIGSYTQKNIPFRSASFSQADVTSGKYVKSDIASLKTSLAQNRARSMNRSPSPQKTADPSADTGKYPLKSELSIMIEPDDESPEMSKRNSDIETITEEPIAESLAEMHNDGLEEKVATINVVQANEMTLDTLIEEAHSSGNLSSSVQLSELQQATTCLIPIPVFECVEKEWSPLPEHGGEEFCNPISEDVLPQAEVIENLVLLNPNESVIEPEPLLSVDHNDNFLCDEKQLARPNIPEVELNNVALQLDEITEKLRDHVSQEEICNVVKTQIPQSKEELLTQKSVDSAEEIRISPEIQEVLETVAETLNEEHKFLTNAIGNANINIVSLICPDQDLSSSDRSTGGESKLDLLKAVDSSDPGSFDKSDSEFADTVRKRQSNDTNSGSEKSSPNASPGINDDKRKIDKSRRRKGIYIQWPAVERSQEIDSFDSSNTEEGTLDAPQTGDNHEPKSKPAEKKLHRTHNLGFSFSEPAMPRQSDSLCSLEPYTPDSDCNANKPIVWPKNSRRQSLTYQSSDERDDAQSTNSPPLRPFRNIFHNRSDSISDNESDRGSSRDRHVSSAVSPNEQDLKRYSKRPLRGPYGQMLEAEMKKPTKVHYDGILEELSRSNSVKKSNCSLDSTGSRGSGFFSRVSKSRKSGGSLPVPMHQRTVSSPVPLIETSSADSLPINHKRYPSSIDQRSVDTTDRLTFKHDTKKLSLDSHLSPKRTSSDTSDKHSKKNFQNEKLIAKRSLDEIRIPTSPADKQFVLNTPETPKNMAATPELLAELLKGSSEKLLNEQTHTKKHQNRNTGSNNGMMLPKAVATALESMDTRTHVIVELFNTEKSYIESLQTIVMKYANPLRQPESATLVDIQTVDEIFYMVPTILNIHEKFLEELGKRLEEWDPLQRIGDAYYEVFSNPKVLETYTAFVNNWNKAKDAIRTTKATKPGFAKFLETMAREHKGKLSLDNLLIKIIQKFPNYELMFQRLTKHTDSEHPDYSGCADSLKLVHNILVHLNCKEREALENGQREATLRELENVIEGISDLVANDRTILRFELVSMPSNTGGQSGRKERGIFLFNDLLVITSIKKRSGVTRKPNSMPGSFTSTLDTNKYKFLTRIPLEELDIVKSKDENVRRIMKEIENLSEDSSKLQQMLDIAANLRYPHQSVDDAIRELQGNVQRQLAERQANDTQLNVLELMYNLPNGPHNMSIVFSKPEKRAQFEEMFTDAKQKVMASMERLQCPEFIASVPIRKTRAGLQFTCAAPTLGAQNDVWVCNSDGYVGQICILTLDQPEPNVVSCNGVCNARILCVTLVPGYSDPNKSLLSSSINDDNNRTSLLSISNASTISNKTASTKSNPNESGMQLESGSSSDSDLDGGLERSVSPSTLSNVSQIPSSDENDNQMWLGTEDGYIHVYNCSDNIRIKKNKIKIPHISAVITILYLDNRIYVSLANGEICIYTRENTTWNLKSPVVLSVGTAMNPVTKLLSVHGKLWCSIQGVVKVLNTATLQVENIVDISNEAKPISNMALLHNHVWISLHNSAVVLCCNMNTFKTVCEVNVAPAVTKMLSNCDNIIQQHKAACLRVTSLMASKEIIWVGTSAGVMLTILAQNIGKSAPIVTGIPQGHTGHVRFLTSVDIDEATARRYFKFPDSHNSQSPDASYGLIISGGDGYEDFRNTGTITISEGAGRDDSTNHLLMWQQIL